MFAKRAVDHQMFLLPGCVCNRVVASLTERERGRGRGSICKQHILSNWQSIHGQDSGCVVVVVDVLLLYNREREGEGGRDQFESKTFLASGNLRRDKIQVVLLLLLSLLLSLRL